MNEKKHLRIYKKVVASIMAFIMLFTGISVSNIFTEANAAFPASRAGKSAKMTWNNRVFSGNLSMLGTGCIERIILTSGKDQIAAFCLSPGKPLNYGSTYKSSELKAGYAKKYYNAALAYYYSDGHNSGSDKYTYRAVTQMFIWRISRFKASTSKDFKSSQLATDSFKSCVTKTLTTMKNSGKVTFAKGKSATDYYNKAKKLIFDQGEDKKHDKEIEFIKWSDGAGQILLTGSYSKVEEVYVNLKIKKTGVNENGKKVKDANLSGVVYYVYDDVKCTNRAKDKDGNKLSITIGSDGEGASSYMKLENDENKTVYIKEHKNVSGVNINNSAIRIDIKGSDFKEGSKNTITVPTNSTVDKVWHTQIVINKKGNDDKKIKGAVFSIYEWNGKKYVDTGDTITTDANGKATSKKYYYTKKNVGKFMVKEKSVPKPYVNEGWSQVIKINGTTVKHEYTVTNPIDKEGDVSVIKTDSKTGEYLNNCLFFLYKSNGSSWKFYSKLDNIGNGIYRKTGLKQGSYAISEVNSQDGYLYPAYYDKGGTLRTADNWQTFLVGVDANGAQVPTYHYTFKYENEPLPISLTVNKIDKDTKEPLSSFEFGLYEYKPNAETDEEKYELVSIQETDENGQITFDNLNITKTYKIKELHAKEGYTLSNDNEQIVNMMEASKADTDKVQMTDMVGTTGHEKELQIYKYQALKNEYETNVNVTFENEKVKRPIRIHKVSSSRTGKESYNVEGAEFSVYDSKELSEEDLTNYLTFDNSKYTPVDVVTTDKTGYAITKDLPYGQYILVETKVPENLLKADNKIIEIDPNIGINENDGNTGVSDTTDDKSDDTVTDNKAESTENQDVAGYAIDENGNEIVAVDNDTSSDDGKYVNTEIIDPEFESRVNIVKKDKITGETVKQAGVQFKVFDVDNNKYVKQTVYETKMTKHEVDDIDDNGNPIKKEVEVEEIINQYDTDTFTTDENGVAQLPNVLPCGHYYVEEVKAPEGFTLSNEKIPFTISKDMEYTIDEKYQDPIIAVNFNNGIIKALFSKTDITTGEKVIGAKLSVLTLDGKIIDSWTTTEEDHLIERMPVGEYILREELAPTDKGYVKANDIKFVINDVGDNIQKIEMKDNYTKVQISKSDITGTKEIKGAKLKVVDSSGKVVRSWITNGQLSLIERLPVGKYKLIEETAPYGYLVAESIDFEVKETGIVQKVNMKDAEAKGVITLKKVDKKTNKPLEGTEFTVYDQNNKKVDVMVTGKDGIAISKKLPLSLIENQSVKYTVVETKATSGYEKTDKKYTATLKYKDDKTPVVTADLGTITNTKIKRTVPTASEIIEHVKTGIQNNMLPFILLLASVGGIIIISISGRKTKKNK